MIGLLPQGAVVHIRCTVRAEPVPDPTGTFGSDLWNDTSHGGSVADIALATGSDDATMPPC
ncbi:hypothetical protein ACI78Q_17010 [Geodermatophilus sp. SYSU D00705]